MSHNVEESGNHFLGVNARYQTLLSLSMFVIFIYVCVFLSMLQHVYVFIYVEVCVCVFYGTYLYYVILVTSAKFSLCMPSIESFFLGIFYYI